jgi:hypothetical protein
MAKPKKSKRKFYQTEYRFTVLSEEPLPNTVNLELLDDLTSEEHMLGRLEVIRQQKITPKRMAEQCEWVGSDSGFFQLTPDGCDDEEWHMDQDDYEDED